MWTDAEISMLRIKYPDMRTADLAALLGRRITQVYNKAYLLGLSKSEAFLNSPTSGRTNGRQGSGTRFVKGHKTWNAGIKGVCGTHENCRKTHFKKGRPPQEARNYKPVGSFRINSDGYLEQKTTDDQSIAPARRWAAVHRLVWEVIHGSVPSRSIVVFKPGCKSTILEEITIDVVELVSRAELMQRNTIHRYPPELKSTIRLVAKLKRTIEAAHE